MGKSLIKSHCQISTYAVNRFNLFSYMSNPISPQISTLLMTDLKSNIKSLIFVLNLTLLYTDFSQHQKRDTCTVGR